MFAVPSKRYQGVGHDMLVVPGGRGSCRDLTGAGWLGRSRLDCCSPLGVAKTTSPTAVVLEVVPATPSSPSPSPPPLV